MIDSADDGSFQFSRREVLLVSAGALLAVGAPTIAGASAAFASPDLGRGQSFNLGWRFFRGDGAGFEAPLFDDSRWRAVDLPHDWSIETLPVSTTPGETIVGPFDSKAIGAVATGFTVGGDGWYRKRFRMPSPAGRRVEILFEGVYENSEVWLNGHSVGTHPNGYTPFSHDLTQYLAPDGDNVIAVHVRDEGRNSRWYSGSGIYRHVWLDVLPEQARIARWGATVITRSIGGGAAALTIATALEALTPGLTLISRIRDASGRVVWEESRPAALELSREATLRSPKLWSPESPALYRLESELRRGGTVLDQQVTTFGVRIVAFDAAQGMTINGAPIKLRGGCIHHDNGLLGACAYEAAEDRKVALLRARGYNAVRPSHNLFSPAFLDACDRYGMMVIEEAFDCWRWSKLPQDYSVFFDDHWRADLAAIVKSTRHHPSIVMWSIGNEIPNRNSAEGLKLQWELANETHRLDPSRAVTAAINSFAGRPVTPAAGTSRPDAAGRSEAMSTVFLDVIGYNYKLPDYEVDHMTYPDRVFFGSESFAKDVFAIWDLTDRSPWLIGDFVWTAMDYIGEAGIGGNVRVPAADATHMQQPATWPEVISSCGDIDLIGQQKAPSYARDVVWGLSPLEVLVQRPIPEGQAETVRVWGWSDESMSWSWRGSEGVPLAVRVYTKGNRVSLLLNGKPAGDARRRPGELGAIALNVPYEAGTLEAVAYRDDVVIGRKQLTSAGAPAAVRLTAERARGGAGRSDISYVLAEIIDADGRLVESADVPVSVSLVGTGELIGFGTARPLAARGYQSTETQTWNGRAQAIVRGTGTAGRVAVTVHAPGLHSSTTTLMLDA